MRNLLWQVEFSFLFWWQTEFDENELQNEVKIEMKHKFSTDHILIRLMFEQKLVYQMNGKLKRQNQDYK